MVVYIPIFLVFDVLAYRNTMSQITGFFLLIKSHTSFINICRGQSKILFTVIN